MAYLGYKNKAFREYQKKQEKIRIWKETQELQRKELKAWIKNKEDKKQKLQEWFGLVCTSTLSFVFVAIIILVYGLLAFSLVAEEKGSKVGVGNFVMAVSYTDSYDDLVYVANFVNCDMAMDYYNQNCTDAKIMMCQLEQYMYMPIGHNSNSSFDFEPTEKQSCGFVGVQKPKFTEDN